MRKLTPSASRPWPRPRQRWRTAVARGGAAPSRRPQTPRAAGKAAARGAVVAAHAQHQALAAPSATTATARSGPCDYTRRVPRMLLPLSHALVASLVERLGRAAPAHLWWPKHLQVELLVLLLARGGVVEPTTGALLDALLEGEEEEVFFIQFILVSTYMKGYGPAMHDLTSSESWISSLRVRGPK